MAAAEVLKTIKENGVKLILIENYFDAKVGDRIKDEVPGVQVVSVPVAVDGAPNIGSIDDLFENLVKIFEEKLK